MHKNCCLLLARGLLHSAQPARQHTQWPFPATPRPRGSRAWVTEASKTKTIPQNSNRIDNQADIAMSAVAMGRGQRLSAACMQASASPAMHASTYRKSSASCHAVQPAAILQKVHYMNNAIIRGIGKWFCLISEFTRSSGSFIESTCVRSTVR